MKLGLSEKDTINSKNIAAYNNERVILWDGFCPIHLNFTVSDVTEMRKKYPEAKVIVHPESTKEVVDTFLGTILSPSTQLTAKPWFLFVVQHL